MSRRLVDTLRWLCEIPSFTGEEGPLCDAVSERVSALAVAAPVRRYSHSLVVPVSRGSGGPHLVLAGHLDVVRTQHDGPVRIEGDKFYGPGAADMKAGLAVMLDLLDVDLPLCRGVDLTMVFYAREEGPYLENELHLVMAEDPAMQAVDLAICLEPSDNKLSLGATGSIHAEVRFRGRTAHSARPWQGDNAIHKAGVFLQTLSATKPQHRDIDGLTFSTVTSATLVSGGRGRNVVPDEMRINVNHRFSPDKSIAQAQAEVEALVAGSADIHWRDLSPAALPHAHHPLVTTLRQAGIGEVEAKQAWTDVARFAVDNIVAVNFGPGVNAQAHQRNEWTSLRKLMTGRNIMSRFLALAATG
ncbi:MAG TPA: succinyl-diaminopimelate desuccinylase [Sorangium sp.]|nr:succinyl-diaminopimelate desuccinylase [Sorangium sp.]